MTTLRAVALVFVHGSWHVPAHLDPIIEMARSRGYEAKAPLLPSCSVLAASNSDKAAADSAIPPPEGWPDHFADARVVRAAIDEPLARGRSVLVVGHSYGGIPASEAVTPEVTFKHRQNLGLAGGVVGIFFMNAYLAPVGMSELEWLGDRAVQCAQMHVCCVRLFVSSRRD